MKYAVTLHIEQHVDVIVDSDTDLSNLKTYSEKGFLINKIERAAIKFYEHDMTNRKLVEEEPVVFEVNADFQGFANDEDKEDPKLTIKLEEWS